MMLLEEVFPPTHPHVCLAWKATMPNTFGNWLREMGCITIESSQSNWFFQWSNKSIVCFCICIVFVCLFVFAGDHITYSIFIFNMFFLGLHSLYCYIFSFALYFLSFLIYIKLILKEQSPFLEIHVNSQTRNQIHDRIYKEAIIHVLVMRKQFTYTFEKQEEMHKSGSQKCPFL